MNQMIDATKYISTKFYDYLFEVGSPYSLSLLRFLLGSYSLWILGTLFAHFDIWFSVDGWMNSSCLNISETENISLLNGVSSDIALIVFFIFTMFCSLFMALGFYTRLFSFLTWLCITSIQSRASAIMCGGDTVIIFMILYLALSDSGASLSIDRYLEIKKSIPRRKIPLFPQKLMAIQLSIIYLSAVGYKLLDQCWVDGSATFYSLHYTFLQELWFPEILRRPPFTNILTYFTLITETALGVCYFIPKIRKFAVLAGIFLHLGIMFSMLIPNFGMVMIFSYLSFYSGKEIESFFNSLKKTFPGNKFLNSSFFE